MISNRRFVFFCVQELEQNALDVSYMSPVKPHEVFGVGEQFVTPSKTLNGSGHFTDPYSQMLNLVSAVECSPIQVA